MKSTEILNKIKTFLGEDKIEQEETQLEETPKEVLELAQLKLENGTVLEADAFEAGNEIFILTEDDKIALPVGEYLTEEGKTLVVEEEGIIQEIKAEEEVEEEAPAEEEEVVEAQYVSKEEFESAVEEIKGMINELKEVKEEMAEVEEQVKQELSETPATKPINHNPEIQEKFKVQFGQNRKETTLDKIMKKLSNN
tara:strand:+ start:261 stop:848 length:588 start_codon:yes stop_codon:yes gene_type:complete